MINGGKNHLLLVLILLNILILYNSRNYVNCQYKFYYFKINPQLNEQ